MVKAFLRRSILAIGYAGCIFIGYNYMQENRQTLRRTAEYCALTGRFCVPEYVSQLEKLRPYVNCNAIVNVYVESPSDFAFDSFSLSRYALSPCRVRINNDRIDHARPAVVHISHNEFEKLIEGAGLSDEIYADHLASSDHSMIRLGDFLYIQ